MTVSSPLALLQSALAYLVDEDRSLFAWRWRRRRKALIDELRAAVRTLSGGVAPEDLASAAREIWAEDYRVRVAERPPLHIDADGLWVGAWLLAAPGLGRDPIDPDRATRALASLTVMTREVYLLHIRDELDYPAIARRLGISVAAVKRELATALLLLDKALNGD